MLRIKYPRVLAIYSKHVCRQKNLRSRYRSFVHPYMTYSIETWGSASKIHLHLLFFTQKKVVRIITFSHYLAHTHSLFLSLSIQPLDKLFLNQIGIVMYKYCNGLLPDEMNRFM